MKQRLVDTPEHDVTIVVAGTELKGWSTYELTGSMLEPAASFTFTMPFSRAAWDAVKPDRVVKIFIDGVQRLVGFIDDREVQEGEDSITVTGRDLVGRLVQESAPTINYTDLTFVELVKRVAEPWFTKITTSNARNRSLTRGKGKKAKALDTALELGGSKKWGTRIEPGQTRWQVIEHLCEQAGLLCWSAGDGRELVIGRPNYKQEVQFSFFLPDADSPRTSDATVLGMGTKDSTEQLYSRVICVGSGQGTDANYGASVTSRYGEERDNPDHPEGIGDSFTAPKRLIIQRPVKSIEEATDLARLEIARRFAHSDTMSVRAAGHGQRIAGAYDTLFDYDLLAQCEHEPTGKAGVYLITAYTMRGSREGSEETSMHLVRKGVELTV